MVKNRQSNKSSNATVNEPYKRGLSRAKRDTLNRKVEELLQSNQLLTAQLFFILIFIFNLLYVECSSAPASNTAIDWEKYNESWNMLNSICELETNLGRSPTSSRVEAFKPFVEWLESHGAKMGDVTLVELPLYGCCVQAVGPVAMGDLLFSIPQELMMTNETVKASKIGKIFHSITYFCYLHYITVLSLIYSINIIFSRVFSLTTYLHIAQSIVLLIHLYTVTIYH